MKTNTYLFIKTIAKLYLLLFCTNTFSQTQLSFDGVDDYMKTSSSQNFDTSFTFMVWIKPNGSNFNFSDKIIASKGNTSNGYQLKLSNSNKVMMTWFVNGVQYEMTSNTNIPNAIWRNIAVTYSNTILSIYIDGVLDKNAAINTNPSVTQDNFCIGALYNSENSQANLFKGDIDEFRLWNISLSQEEIRFIMNQEIKAIGTTTAGSIIPSTISKNDISALNWNNLIAYYNMNSFVGNNVEDNSNFDNHGIIINGKLSISTQTAPIPYNTNSNGLWSNANTWQYGSLQSLPNSVSIVDNTTPINWNIVKIKNNVESKSNKTLLGLLIDNNTLSATNNTKLEISHYLKLTGKIDLVDSSQLIQSLNSDIETSTSGLIERDQKGHTNKYSYNYWSSPVFTNLDGNNNKVLTVDSVMKDGTISINPQNINWYSGYDGIATTPITLSSYWIFKYQNLSYGFANWSSVGPYGILNPGQGFTLKGSDAEGIYQNYTFVGKPNNGEIFVPILAGNLNLCGNPYPSAIDANEFIKNNSNSISGTLYFWEHYETNTSHNLIDYQGGYATRTLVGGAPPVSPNGTSQIGSSKKIPGRYIPVGQAFLVKGNANGGNIKFNNNQRVFVKEKNSNSNDLFRATVNTDYNNNNDDDELPEDEFKKIRLGFDTADGYHRQILLGFMNENASSGFDLGYDALNIDTQPSDIYFVNGNSNLIIQGEGYFNLNNSYPLKVKNGLQGIVKFTIDEVLNIEESQDIYLYDALNNSYHNIRTESYEVDLQITTVNDRFFLRFANPALTTPKFNIEETIYLNYNVSNKTIFVNNNSKENTIKSISLYNMLGQNINNWNIDNKEQSRISIPVIGTSTGTYIVKVQTLKGDSNKKIIIN